MNENASVLINKKSGHGNDIDHKHRTITKGCSKDTLFKVGAGALFVLITEMCLGLLIYQHMAREFKDIRSNFALKAEMEDYFFRLFRSDALQDEFSTNVLEKIGTRGILSRIKRHNYFYLGHNCKPKQRQSQAASLEASPTDNARAVIQGPPGPPGLPGDKGAKGESGQLTVSGQHTPIDLIQLQARIASLKGERGLPGVPALPGQKGEKGDHGWQGSKGNIGRDGVPGKRGVRGYTGETGQPGYLGLSGRQGMPGPPGLPGNDGLPGPMGPPGPPGPPGLPSSARPSGPAEKAERVNPAVPETKGSQRVSRLLEYKRNSVTLPETEMWRSQMSDIPSDLFTFRPGAIGMLGTAPPPPTEPPSTTESEYQLIN